MLARSLSPLVLPALVLAWCAGAAVATGQDDEPAIAPPLVVRGQLVNVDGAPVVGVVPRVHGYEANNDLARTYGVPADWQDPVPGATDAEGRFEFTLVPPRAFAFQVSVESEGHGAVGWHWLTHQHTDSRELDLGRVVLEEPGVIEGHVEDADGQLLVEGWTLLAHHRVPTAPGAAVARDHVVQVVEVDPGTGTFTVDGLPPGTIELRASHPTGARIGPVVVETRSGQLTRPTLVYRGPDVSRRVALSISTGYFHAFHPAEGHVHAISATGERHPLTPVPGRSNEWHAVDLEEGLYTLEVDDPRFEPWRQEDVRTGTLTRIGLAGSAALALTVLDPKGRHVEGADLELRRDPPGSSPGPVVLQDDGQRLPADGRLTGIVPGSWTLRVTPVGGVPQHVRVADLRPGETRDVVVQLVAAATITGRVLGPDGSPLEGVRVQRTHGELQGHDGAPGDSRYTSRRVDGESRMLKVGHREEEVRTDAEGRYAFTGLAEGSHALRALLGPHAVDDRVVRVSPGEAVERDLHLPATGSLRVRVLLPEGVDPVRVEVSVRPAPPVDSPMELRPEPLDAREPRTFAHLPVGEVRGDARLVVPMGPSSYQFLHLADFADTVRAGSTTEHVLDLRATFPVEGRVRVLRDGEPVTLGQVLLEAIDDGDPSTPTGSPFAFTGLPDGSGWTPIHGATPGRYRAVVRSVAQGWCWRAPETLDVHPGTPFELVVDVPFVERTIRVLGPDGRPRAERDVHWSSVACPITGAHASTDADGRLVLSLPPGEYHLIPTPPGHVAGRPLAGDASESASTFTLDVGDTVLDVVVGD